MNSFAKLKGKRYARWSREIDESKAVAVRPLPISRLYISKVGEVNGGYPRSPSSNA
jgi:hypothetical protein